MAKSKVVICPYCGETQPAGESCRACGGLFEPLSRQATHNAMGPWYLRDPDRPFQPGASYATIMRMIERGQVTKLSIIRGPTTKQFWTIAKRVPGIAHLLGYCHACDAPVEPGDHGCHVCGARFGAYMDRNYLGLPEIQPLPWEESPQEAPETSALSATPPRPTAETPEDRGIPGPRQFRESGGFEPADAVPGGAPGGRISSFATDEELLGPDGQGERAWGGGGGSGTHQPAEVAKSESESSPAPEQAATAQQPTDSERAARSPESAGPTAPPEPHADESVVRLAQRRTRRLQQTVSRLWLALLVVLLANVVLLAIIVFNRGPDQPATTDGVKPEAAQRESATPTEAAEPAGVEGDDAQPMDAAEPADAAPPPDEAASPTPTVDEPETTGEPMDRGFDTVLADAEALIEAAEDDQRELSDRIADYESALKLLREVQANAPNEAKPDDLAERIEQAERNLERLRLREFFP